MIAPVDYDQMYQRRRDSAVSPGFEYSEQPAEKQGSEVVDTLRHVIGRHPVLAIATATTIGAAAAWLIKRGVR